MGSRKKLLLDRPGLAELLLGNDAIVRGAIEAGVGFACGYPGTPSTEVTEGFAELAPALGIPFEYSVNEKIALEMAFAASLAGCALDRRDEAPGADVRGRSAQHHPLHRRGRGHGHRQRGGPVLLHEPQRAGPASPRGHAPHSAPRSEDAAGRARRHALRLRALGALPAAGHRAPHDPRLSHDGARALRTDPRDRRVSGFVRSPGRYVPMPANARKFRTEIIERLETARELIETPSLFSCSGSRRRDGHPGQRRAGGHLRRHPRGAGRPGRGSR